METLTSSTTGPPALPPKPQGDFLNSPTELRHKILFEANCLECEITLTKDAAHKRYLSPSAFLICKTISLDLKAMMKTWLPGPDTIVRCMSPEAIPRLAKILRTYRQLTKIMRHDWNGVNVEIMFYAASTIPDDSKMLMIPYLESIPESLFALDAIRINYIAGARWGLAWDKDIGWQWGARSPYRSLVEDVQHSTPDEELMSYIRELSING